MYENLKEFLTDDFWIMPATPKYIDNGIPYITSKNIKNGKIDYSNINYISKEDYENISKNRPIKVNDILISMIGTIGETAVVSESDGEFYGQNMFLVRLNENKINQRFFLNYFKSSFVKNQLFSKQNKSTQSYLKANHIEDLKVPVISIQEQIKISEKLDKIQIMIDEKKEQINLLNQLIKSQFVEMFGDPLVNDGMFEMKLIKQIGKVVSGATPKTNNDEFWNGNNIWVTPAELNDNSFVISDSERKITDLGVKSCAVNLLPKNTVILSSRAPIGKTAIAGVDMYCNQGFKNIIPSNEINSIYLYELLKNKTEYLNSLGRGATFKEISKEIVENIKIKVPPIVLQNMFAQIVEQIDKQKFEFENSLNKLEELQASLMQEYFG